MPYNHTKFLASNLGPVAHYISPRDRKLNCHVVLQSTIHTCHTCNSRCTKTGCPLLAWITYYIPKFRKIYQLNHKLLGIKKNICTDQSKVGFKAWSNSFNMYSCLIKKTECPLYISSTIFSDRNMDWSSNFKTWKLREELPVSHWRGKLYVDQ